MITIRNNICEFEITLEGSAFTKFTLHDLPINPLNWQLPLHRLPHTNTNGFPFKGHFIALGTWGYPTPGEIAAGLKFYGDVNTQHWQIVDHLRSEDDRQIITTACRDGIEKLDCLRRITLYNNALIEVREEVTNNLPIGRPYNFLQHATFGGDFLHPDTIINTNAGKGFYQNGEQQRASFADIEDTSYDWPHGVMPFGSVDLRHSNASDTYVSTHTFHNTESLGWATIANKEKGLLVGYVWNLKEYPWLNVWYQFEEGEIKGRAVEFATCGMWNSFEYMMTHDSRFFGQNSFEFIDAGETKVKTYFMFLLPIAFNFKSIKHISRSHSEITLLMENENNEITHTLHMQ